MKGKIMKAFAIPLGLALAVAGCSMSGEEDPLENSIRENLSTKGNVQQVELTRQDENTMTGFAVVRDAQGLDGRYNCTARRTQGPNFEWQCIQTIDEQLINRIETDIRSQLGTQGEVLEVELSRQDDNKMSGHALVRTGNGEQIRTECVANRDSPNSGNFHWECNPAQ